jgi:hypothetical protein
MLEKRGSLIVGYAECQYRLPIGCEQTFKDQMADCFDPNDVNHQRQPKSRLSDHPLPLVAWRWIDAKP